MKIIIAGCGALGSHIALQIAHEEMEFVLIDNDHVEPHNVLTGTTPYFQEQIGNKKVDALGEFLYRKYRIKPMQFHLNIKGIKNARLQDADLLIDCFDNADARECVSELNIPVVYVGVSPQFIGAIEWNETYELPKSNNKEENQICTHEVGRDLILLTSVVASIIIRHYLRTGEKQIATVNNNLEIF